MHAFRRHIGRASKGETACREKKPRKEKREEGNGEGKRERGGVFSFNMFCFQINQLDREQRYMTMAVVTVKTQLVCSCSTIAHQNIFSLAKGGVIMPDGK